MISFKQDAGIFKKFVQLATVDFGMNQLGFDVGNKTLFTSAKNNLGNCWAVVIGTVPESEGKGSFAVNLDDFQKIMKTMNSKWDYDFNVDDNLMIVSAKTRKSKLNLPLFDEHTRDDNDDSTYIQPNEKYGGKRFEIGMARDKTREIFIPLTPKGKPWEQVLALDPKETKSILKNISAIQSKFVTLGMEHGSPAIKVYACETAVEHTESVKALNGFESKFNWEVKFDEVLMKIINMADDELYVAVTEENLPHPDGSSNINCGIWIVIKNDDITAHFWLTPSLSEE